MGLVKHIATRWEIEVFFEDTKDVLGIDHYQLMTTAAVIRFWTLVMAAYVFLDEQRTRLSLEQEQPVSIGEARRSIQRTHACHLIDWIYLQFSQGRPPGTLYKALVP